MHRPLQTTVSTRHHTALASRSGLIDRCGIALFEALVALIVIGVLGALIARGVQIQGRAAAEVSARTEARRALRAAAAPVAAELRHALIQGDAALSLAGDTIRTRTLISDGMACVTHDGRLALLGTPSNPPLAAWRTLPDTRDALRILRPYSPGEACDGWGETSIVAATQSATAPAPCHMDAGGRVQLLTAGAPFALTPGETLAVQVLRRVTWRLTTSDGGWYLSRARCDGAAGGSIVCDASQPVAGPLLATAAGGLQLRPLGANGVPLSPANQALAQAVELQLVAPVAATRLGASTAESLSVVVPLPRGCP